jgi:PAS domain S-box-containing protein
MKFPHYIALVLLGLSTTFRAASPAPKDSIILQLKWKHQFQFAGYYAALHKGFYKKAGLAVTLKEANSKTQSIEAVSSGKAQYGVASSDLIVARSKGIPVVLLANIFQHSPHIFISKKHSHSDNIHDLDHKTLMLEPNTAELRAYLKAEGVEIEPSQLKTHTFSIDPLLENKVYAMSAYSTDEPYDMQMVQAPYTIYNPRSSGIDFYGDALFTSEQELANHPDRVKAFRKASIEGWKYALAHPQEIIELIYSKYTQRHNLAHLQYEARETQKLIVPEVIEIGYVNEHRWERIIEIYQELGLLQKAVDLTAFVYNPNPKEDTTFLFYTIGGILILLLILTAIVFYFFRLNKRLKREISLRIEKGKQLYELEERYRKLVENSPFPIIITLPETGEILYVNELATNIFEMSMEKAMQQHVATFFSTAEERQRYINAILKHGYVRDFEVSLRTTSGREFCAFMTANFIQFNGKRALFTSFVDISNRIELETKLKDALDTKDKFFSIIAHDLKGPIGNLNSFFELLFDQESSMEKEQQDLLFIQCKNLAESTYELLDNLLLWAQLQKNEIILQPTPQSLFELASKSIRLFHAPAAQKNIRIENNICQDLLVNIDKNMINTVLRNLINNAIKFTPNNGKITLNCAMEGSLIHLQVTDSGIGMSATKCESLFNSITTKNSTLGTAGEKGTGLGLLICKDFIQKHGGTIWVESELGKGSCFHFTIAV